MVGQQQDQRRVQFLALLQAQVAVRVDQRLVEIIGRGQVGVGNQHVHCSGGSDAADGAIQRGRDGGAVEARQRAAMCWSGRIR